MDWIVGFSSFLSIIISIVLVINVWQFSKTNKLVKILVLLLFITIVGGNLFNLSDFYHGFIDGVKSY